MEIRNHIYHFSVDPKATGERIRDLRKAKGLTADKLAEKLYRSPKTISSWETGTRFPSIDNLVDLANLFEVSVHSLMLPNDNCDVEPLETESVAGVSNHFDSKYSLDKVDDEFCSKIFIREEYLLQRFFSDVFTKANRCEYSAIMRFAFDVYTPLEKDINSQKQDSYSCMYFNVLKAQKNRYKKFHILFNRLWRGENMPLTLASLNKLERDILFTACLYFSELRDENYTRALYNLGARFIDCDFIGNKQMILSGIEGNKKSKIFNKYSSYINSEEDLIKLYGLPEELYEYLFSASLIPNREPRFIDDPDYYAGRIFTMSHEDETVDLDAREKLAAYYFLLDFIRGAMQEYEDYEKNVIEQNGMNCSDYVFALIKGGAISK